MMDEAEKQMRRGLQALYLEVAPEIVEDVTKRVDAALREAEERGRRDERRACAEIARQGGKRPGETVFCPAGIDPGAWGSGYQQAMIHIAQAIEARGGEG